MADRKLITDRFLQIAATGTARPARRSFDARVPGFGIRISDTKDVDPARRGKAGKISFILYARFSAGSGTDPPRHRHLWRDHAWRKRGAPPANGAA